MRLLCMATIKHKICEHEPNGSSSANENRLRLVILMPVFNDWDSVTLLIPRLDEALEKASLTARLLLINDGSTMPWISEMSRHASRSLQHIEVLHLWRNIGHQRAIAVALCHVYDNTDAEAIVIMDADGEDLPEDIHRLVHEFENQAKQKIIFAERTRRSEGLIFRIFYLLFCWMHILLTGRRVKVGNFSILPRRALASLRAAPELWSHYAAAVFKLRLSNGAIPTFRGVRLAGSSRMNFVSLVIHGLTAISVFGDVLGTRLLAGTSGLVMVAFFGIGGVVSIRLLTDWAIPGWTTYAVGILILLLIQATMLSTMFIFIILGSRQANTFLPVRDYRFYVNRLENIK